MGASSFHRWLYIPPGRPFCIGATFFDSRTSVSNRVGGLVLQNQAPRAWRAGEHARACEQAVEGKTGALATNRSRDMSGENV